MAAGRGVEASASHGPGEVHDVIVVGGGIVGTSAAAFLAEAGLRVLVVDRHGLASGASGANSGVVQHPFDPAMATLYRATLALYRELAAADVGFHLPASPAGMLYLSPHERVAREVDAEVAAHFPELDHEVLGESTLRRADPAVGEGLWACRVGIGYPVQPAGSTYGFATLAERRGAVIRSGRAARLELVGDRVTGVILDGERLAAATVLVAAGPWTSELIDPTGGWMPIRPRWGVVVETLLPAGPRHVLEEAEIASAIGAPEPAARPAFDPDEARNDFSLVPLDGIGTVGSTFLAREPDPSAWVERLLERASRFVPGVLDAPIRGARACARPQSLDRRPLVGAVPGRRGLFVCAGHGAWGISTGPGSAALVAELILERPVTIPDEFAVDRFDRVALGRAG